MKPKLALILLITVVSFSTSFANLTLFADVTGDGTEEFLEFKNDGVYVEGLRWVQGFGANNGWTESRHLRMAEDLDSDGKADIIGFGETDVWVAYSTGSNFSVPTIILSNGPCIANGFTIEQHPRLLGDLNGDSYLDIVAFGTNDVFASFSNGYRNWNSLEYALYGSFGLSMGWSSQYYYERLLCDVNVDGKMDIVGFGHNDIFISIFNAQNNMFEPAYSAGEGFGFGCFYDQNNTNRESGISNGKAIVKNSVHYDYRGCECLASCHRRILVDLVFNYNTSTHKYEAEVDWNSIPTITGYGVISCHPRYPWECN